MNTQLDNTNVLGETLSEQILFCSKRCGPGPMAISFFIGYAGLTEEAGETLYQMARDFVEWEQRTA